MFAPGGGVPLLWIVQQPPERRLRVSRHALDEGHAVEEIDEVAMDVVVEARDVRRQRQGKVTEADLARRSDEVAGLGRLPETREGAEAGVGGGHQRHQIDEAVPRDFAPVDGSFEVTREDRIDGRRGRYASRID